MTARRSVLLQLLALAVAIGMSLVVWPFLRRAAPVGFGLAFEPLMGMALLGLTVATVRGRGVPSAGLFGALALAAGLFAAEHAFLLGAAVRGFFSVRLLLAVAFGVFFGLAPVMARVEQNPWFGVRTPWTLGSRRVWKATHRATGRLWLFGGALGSALSMFGAPLPLVIVCLVALALAPVAISYRVWQRLGKP